METIAPDIKEETQEHTALIQIDVSKPLRPDRAKLTKQKRIILLQEYAKDYNLARAAAVVGVTRQSVVNLIERDEKFSNAIDQVKQAYLDSTESAMFQVACSPSREGYNDRKLALQSHRRETYGDKVDVNANVKVASVNAHYVISDVLAALPALDVTHADD